MPKWKNDETKFPVSVNFNKKHGHQTTIPKPIVDLLEITDQVTFLVKGKHVEVIGQKPDPKEGGK